MIRGKARLISCLVVLALMAGTPWIQYVRAAVSVAEVATVNTTTDATTFTTGAFTATSGNCYIAFVESTRGTTADAVSGVTGGGTWVTIVDQLAGVTTLRITAMRAAGDGTSWTPTFAFSGATQTGADIKVLEVTGMDTGGASCSGAIVQSPTGVDSGNSTTATVTMASFGDATNNVALLGSVATSGTQTWAPEAGGIWTELGTELAHTVGTGMLGASWRAGEDTSATNTFGTAGRWAAIALEIKMAAAPGGGCRPSLGLLGVGGGC